MPQFRRKYLAHRLGAEPLSRRDYPFDTIGIFPSLVNPVLSHFCALLPTYYQFFPTSSEVSFSSFLLSCRTSTFISPPSTLISCSPKIESSDFPKPIGNQPTRVAIRMDKFCPPTGRHLPHVETTRIVPNFDKRWRCGRPSFKCTLCDHASFLCSKRKWPPRNRPSRWTVGHYF